MLAAKVSMWATMVNMWAAKIDMWAAKLNIWAAMDIIFYDQPHYDSLRSLYD